MISFSTIISELFLHTLSLSPKSLSKLKLWNPNFASALVAFTARDYQDEKSFSLKIRLSFGEIFSRKLLFCIKKFPLSQQRPFERVGNQKQIGNLGNQQELEKKQTRYT